MATVTAVLAKIAAVLKKIAEARKIQKGLKVAKEVVDKGKRTVVTIIAVVILLPCVAAGAILGPAYELCTIAVDRLWGFIGLSESDVYNSMDDAIAFHEKLELINELGTEDRYDAIMLMNLSLSCMDVETLELIVGEVSEYNYYVSGYRGFYSRTVYDEYRQETVREGEFPNISSRTGNIIEPEIQSARTVNVSTLIRGQGVVGGNTGGFAVSGGLGNIPNNGATGSPDLRPNNNVVNGFMDYVNNGGNNGNPSSGFVPGTGLVPVVTPRPSTTPSPSSGGNGFATPPGVVPPNAIPQLPTGTISPDVIRPIITPSTPAPGSTPAATPEPTATPEPRYSVAYPDRGQHMHSEGYDVGGISVSVKDIEDAWDCGPDGRYERMDKLQWQPVAALCCYYIAMTPEKWGTYTGPEDTKYISKEKVQELLDIFAFEYTYVQEVQGNRTDTRYEFNDYMQWDSVKSPFKTLITYDTGWGGRRYRNTYRNPMFAPYRIANSYISYMYEYERGEEYATGASESSGIVEYAYVKSLTYNVQPSRLIDAMKAKVPGFNEVMYISILKILPKSENYVEYFENVILADDADELQTFTTTFSDSSPTINVVTGLRQYSSAVSGGLDVNGNASGMPNFGEGSTLIALYPADGQLSAGVKLHIEPHEDIVEEGASYGLYEVKNAATAPLDVLDMEADGGYISGIAINRMVNSVEFLNLIPNWETSPLLHNKETRDQFASALYSFQEWQGSSVAGTLAIMKQEGGFTSRYGRNGYNYYNIAPGRSWQYGKVGGFRDYKDAHANGAYNDVELLNATSVWDITLDGNDRITDVIPAVAVFYEQACWVDRNYWKDGQNTYYTMIFNGYGRGATTGIGAYQQVSHSYCPPWDDTAMPYSPESYTITYDNEGNSAAHHYWRASTGTRNRGWTNNCADYREKFLMLLRKAENNELTPFVQ